MPFRFGPRRSLSIKKPRSIIPMLPSVSSKLYGMNTATPVYYNGIRQFSNLVLGHRPQNNTLGDFPLSMVDLATGNLNVTNSDGFYSFLWPTTVPGARIRFRHAGTSAITLQAGHGANITYGNDGTYDYFDFDFTHPVGQDYCMFNIGQGTVTFLDAREVTTPLTEKFPPAYVAACARWKMIRFMDWSFTNDTADISFTETNRPRPNQYIRAADWGQSFEDAIDLCAAADIDAWICIPYRVTQGYIDALVTYAHTHMPAGRQVYLELSNEIWNYGFRAYGAMREDWIANNTNVGDPGNTYSQQAFTHNRYMTWVEAKAAALGATVGETGRFVRVLGVQMGGGPNMEFLFDRPNLMSHTDRVALAPYFGNVYNDLPTAHDTTSLLLRAAYSTQGGGIDQIVQAVVDMRTQIVARGKKMICYESGSHMIGVPINELQNSIDYHNDPRFRQTFSYYLSELKKAGGPDFPVNIFSDFGVISQYGPWGAQTGITDISPRLLALLDAQQGIYTPPALVITSDPLPAIQGTSYSYQIDARYGAGYREPKTYAISAGSLPAGLTLNTTTGLITGIPTNAGSTSFTVQATDASGTATKAVTITAAAAEVYTYDDDARSVGNIPSTGAGSSRLPARGWSQDIGYAKNGYMHMDQFRANGQYNNFASGINGKNRKLTIEIDTTLWTKRYDNVGIHIVAPYSGETGNGVNVNISNSSGSDGIGCANFIGVGKNNAYFNNIGTPLGVAPTAPLKGSLTIELIDGVVKVYYNGAIIGEPSGYAVGTDYNADQPVAYAANLDPEPYANIPIYSRFAVRLVGPVAPDKMPNEVMSLQADEITGKSNTAAMTTWADPNSGVVFAGYSGSNSPTYQTSGSLGKPCVKFDGLQSLALSGSNAVKTALDSQEYTILVAIAGVQANDYGNIFGTAVGGNSLTLSANGTVAGGPFGNGSRVPYDGTGLLVLALRTTKTARSDIPFSTLTEIFANGLPVASYTNTAPGTETHSIGLGAGNVDATPAFFFKGEVYAVKVSNKFMTQDEVLVETLKIYTALNVPHPSVAKGKVFAAMGNSINAGVGQDVPNSGTAAGSIAAYPIYKLAQAQNLPLGTWANYSLGGSNLDDINQRAPLGLFHLYQRLGVRIDIMIEEYVNSRNFPTSGTGSLAEKTTAFATAARAALGTGHVTLGVCTPADLDDTYGTGNAAWSAYIRSNYATMGYDYMVDIAANTSIGLVDAYERNHALYWGDSFHLNQAGSDIRFGVMSEGYNSSGYGAGVTGAPVDNTQPGGGGGGAKE